MLPSRIETKFIPEPNTGCWLWFAYRDRKGYGTVGVGTAVKYAHRVVYETLRGPIPEGLQLDHLCRVRCCVNPDHLEPVTNQENARRGDNGKRQRARTHCPRGHAYDAANTAVNTRGDGRKFRVCRTCDRAR